MGEKLERRLTFAWDALREAESIAAKALRRNIKLSKPTHIELNHNGLPIIMRHNDGVVELTYAGSNSNPLNPKALTSGMLGFAGKNAVFEVKAHVPSDSDRIDIRDYGIINDFEGCTILGATAVLPLSSHPRNNGIEVVYIAKGDSPKSYVLTFRDMWSTDRSTSTALFNLGGDYPLKVESKTLDDGYKSHLVAELRAPLKSIGDFIERVERYGSNIQSSGCFVSKVHAYADAGDPSFAQKPGFMEVSRGYGKDGIMYQFDPNGGNGETLCVIVRPSKLAKAASVFEGLKL